MDLKSLKDIPTSFSLAKRALIVCLIVSILNTIVIGAWAFYITNTFGETAYIITDSGQMALAKGIGQSEFVEYREPEIKNHIKVFHERFWNLDQFSIQKNMTSALHLIGNSGKQLYLSMKAQGHFGQIRNQNLVQTLLLDSIAVNTGVTPYKCAYYGKLKIKRTDQNKEKVERFMAVFDVHNVTRTDLNPHGLLIENYEVKTK